MKENYTKYLFYFLILVLIYLYFIRKHKDFSSESNTIKNISYYQHFSKLDRNLRKCGGSAKECRDFYLRHMILDPKRNDIANKEIIN